jgi:glycerol-3-phosphate O-acyltransferase
MFSFLIRKRIFSLITFFLKPIIKFEIEFEDGASAEIIKKAETVYATPSDSVTDLVALQLLTEDLDISYPLSKILNSNLNRFTCLKAPVFSQKEQKIVRQASYNLESIIELDESYITIIPTSFYWGKHPDKQKSLFKILFSQSWSATSPIKKLFKIIFHGRSLVIKFHKPLAIDELKDKGKNTKDNARLISRYLRALFRRSKQAKLGPDISHRRTLVHSLSQNTEVKKEIERLSQGDAKIKKRLKKKSLSYANEICSDLNYPIVRLLIKSFSWFWNTRYDGIHIKNLEEIKKISSENSIVYVPCHRSHIDYCALSYILYENGLMVPQIPSGNNLNLPIMGRILRGGGAIFMRRSFNNPLYSTIFFQHIRNLIRRGSSIEFFPEGGRSRSGLSLPSRPGLISMIIRSFASLESDNVKIVPIYIGYEKILEGQSYLSELSGKSKKGESLLDPLKVLKDFNNYLGNAYINFGSPIDLGSFLREEVEESDLKKNVLNEKPEWLRKATTSLGELIIQGINSSVAVTTTSLFSISLLTDSTQSLSEDRLKQKINMYLDLIKNSKTYNHVWLTNTNASEIINKTEELKLIRSQLVGNSRIFKPTNDETSILSFYKNNISHIFILYSAVCESLRYVNEISYDEVLRLVRLVFPFLKRDYHLLETDAELDDLIKNTLKTLMKSGLIEETKSGNLIKPNSNTAKYEDFIALSNICEPSIKRFFIVLNTLWEHPSIKREELKKLCTNIAKKLESFEGWPYPEFSDKTKFDQFIDKLVLDKLVKEDEDLNLQAARITKRVKKDYLNFFNQKFINLINQMN